MFFWGGGVLAPFHPDWSPLNLRVVPFEPTVRRQADRACFQGGNFMSSKVLIPLLTAVFLVAPVALPSAFVPATMPGLSGSASAVVTCHTDSAGVKQCVDLPNLPPDTNTLTHMDAQDPPLVTKPPTRMKGPRTTPSNQGKTTQSGSGGTPASGGGAPAGAINLNSSRSNRN
jgi:hypothetical protein